MEVSKRNMEEETQIRPIPGIAASPAPSVYSLEFKPAKLREFTQSGKSMKQFALENGIPDKTFWCWVEKAREGGMEGMPPKLPQPERPALPPVDITTEVKGAGRGSKPAGPKATARIGGAKFTFPADMLIEVMRELAKNDKAE
jgi:transposase-like protein